MSDIDYNKLHRGSIVFFARVLSNTNYYEILELHIVSVYDDYCTGTDLHTKQTYLFNKSRANEVLFFDRKLAVEYLNQKKKGG